MAEVTKHLTAAASISADLEQDDVDILQRRSVAARPRGSGPAGPRWWLVVALLIGVAFGAWMAGRHSSGSSADPVEATPANSMAGMMPGHGAEAKVRLEELEESLKTNPNDINALLEIGTIFFALGQEDQAHDSWLKVTELDPEVAEAWYNLGFYYMRPDSFDQSAAIDAFEAFIDLQPDSDHAENAQEQLDLLRSAPTNGS